MRSFFKQYIGEKPQNPSVEEVKSEIEKELQAAFKKKEAEALELYEKGNAAYENNQFEEAVFFFGAALKIVKTPSFHLARGTAILLPVTLSWLVRTTKLLYSVIETLTTGRERGEV